MYLSDTMKAAIRTGRNDSVVYCGTATERALVARGLIHPVNSNLTAAGIKALEALDAENPPIKPAHTEVPAIPGMPQMVRESVEYMIQISEDGGQWWRVCPGYAYRDRERAIKAMEQMDAGKSGALTVFRVIEARQTWTVAAETTLPDVEQPSDTCSVCGKEECSNDVCGTESPVAHPDATDLAHADDPTYDQCPRCTHLWPLDAMARDRNGDNICPDCMFS